MREQVADRPKGRISSLPPIALDFTEFRATATDGQNVPCWTRLIWDNLRSAGCRTVGEITFLLFYKVYLIIWHLRVFDLAGSLSYSATLAKFTVMYASRMLQVCVHHELPRFVIFDIERNHLFKLLHNPVRILVSKMLGDSQISHHSCS